jgi:N-hydroxyarylamine O-acetyltransferase
MVDLDAYFERIGYRGAREPTLKTLNAIQALHPAAIPFENLDVFLDRGIDLAPEAVDAKLIHGRRGGYCFEQNNLLKRVFTALGFEVEGLIGRSRWNRPLDAPGPRTHMVLRVTIEGEAWLADVGFGGVMLGRALRFADRDAQPAIFDTLRLSPIGDEIRLGALVHGDWLPVYDLSMLPQYEIDYEAANWFTSTHPASHFRHSLMAARTLSDVRYNLLNNRLTTRRPGAEPERRRLEAHEIGPILAETFGLATEPDWTEMYQRAVAAGDGV